MGLNQGRLTKTITVAVEIGLIKPEELKKVVVDSTVMPKAIAHLREPHGP